MANIQEIARLAGVSTATISRVINGHPHVSESTRKKVIELIEQLDYVPNGNAITLKKGATCLIGIVAVAFNPLLIRFMQAFTQSAEKHGFNITLFITNGQVEKEMVALEMLKRKQLDAIVCVLRSNEWKVIESYTKYGPIVTWQRLENSYIPSVFMDQYEAYRIGLEHLYLKGYREILSVYPISNGLNTKERMRAYADFITKYKLTVDFPNFQDKIYVRDGEELAKWWIAQTNRPDAIFCANDEVAAGFIAELRRSKFSVPGDVGIIGFDNTEVAHLFDLTTIHYPVDQQAENAFTIIQNMLDTTTKELIPLKYTLVERQST
ncbi:MULTISPECIES: LacI family DNA-binding transcriptional regulator [unclassified Paenibacillus]|uniref:LacI family DNA-binding transcriptional regulator n=1 Tax=unclassified Paenibacillus TaxID=185978 RepID=UPI000CFDF0A6|nr:MULTISPECIES: LacI family DNA-binding transcriptional regulator [unclassified Paenibacillus]PRA07842.1 LacI family transcriptional regulator [Paenibacillus sp. MYb63]PRA51486.1 LacI family transcriptional regulator [Paenibacillus sp. MYb67]